jgi:hypothetical protein
MRSSSKKKVKVGATWRENAAMAVTIAGSMTVIALLLLAVVYQVPQQTMSQIKCRIYRGMNRELQPQKV